jgi:hypothetical protein
MPRLCELPSCSRFADVAYGFDAAKRLLWFDQYDESVSDTAAGRLCRRHAESLIPPRGWVLENRRAEAGALFEPIPAAKPVRVESPKAAVAEPVRVQVQAQEALSLELPFGQDLGVAPDMAPELAEPAEAVPPVSAAAAVAPDTPPEPAGSPAWKPSFNTSDDVSLLNATTPLLSRAFTAGVKEKP